MCTVSFLARPRGYALGMNRDEQMTRVPGLPPAVQRVAGRRILAPSEPGGGKWIALNEAGVTFALINWYHLSARVKNQPVSRGWVVQEVCAAVTPAQADAALARLPFTKMNPFRLIGIFPASAEILEWRWDLRRLDRKRHRWADRQWISSGRDEPAAQRIRGRTFRAARQQRSAGRLDWLRRLHRSHAPERGAFSTCMHRPDAATVSYTEIVVSATRGTLRYLPGAPCMNPAPHVHHHRLSGFTRLDWSGQTHFVRQRPVKPNLT